MTGGFNNTVRKNLVIGGTGNGTGFFEYNGTPKNGNPPVAYATPPGVSKDPFGNPLPSTGGGFVAVNSPEIAILVGNALAFKNGTPNLDAQVSGFAAAAGCELDIVSGRGTGAATAAIASFLDSLQSAQGVGQIVIARATLPGTPATTALLEVQGRAALVDIASGDTNAYHAERLILTASGQLVNSAAATPVTGLAGIPVAAIPYLMRGMIIVDQGNVGVNPNQAIQVAGPAVSSMNIAWNCIEAASIFSSGVQTTLLTNLTTGAVPNNTTAQLHFDGRITFSSSGLFGLEALCVTAAADTWTLRAGSWMELIPV